MRIIKLRIPFFLLTAAMISCAGNPNDDISCEPCTEYMQPREFPQCKDLAAPQPTYRNLVLQGAGVKGIAYGGALLALNEAGHIKPLERVAGTSAGSVSAAMLALGYNACTVADFARNFDYNQLKDGAGLAEGWRLIKNYGLYKGDVLECTVRCLVENKLDRGADSTFADLAKQKEKDDSLKFLYVVAANLSTENDVTFSHESAFADIAIADAVRKSMSIPFFFRATTLPGSDDVFADGGIVRNYPIDIFDHRSDDPIYRACVQNNPSDGNSCTINAQTLGLHVSDNRQSSYPVNNILQFVKQFYHTLVEAQTDLLCDAEYNVERTVFIDTFDIKGTDFNISDTDRERLMESGKEHTRDYLNRENPLRECPDFIQLKSDGEQLPSG